MQAVILCGGRGERLMPMTAKTPGALLRICRKEILLYNIEMLKNTMVDHITLAVNYGAGQIENFAKKHTGEIMPIDFSSVTNSGTSAAIAFAADPNEDNILVINGNCIYEADIGKVIDYHLKQRALCTALVTSRENADGEYYVSVGKKSKVNSLVTKPSAEVSGYNYCLEGIFVINRKLFNLYSFDLKGDFVEDILPLVAENNQGFYAIASKAYWQPVITPHGFLSCQEHFLDRTSNSKPAEEPAKCNGCSVIPPVMIGKNVKIEEGSVINKYTVIDDGAIVGAKTKINGGYVGKNAVLENNCEINKAIICENAFLESFVKADEYSVAAEGSFLGEGCELNSHMAVWADKKIPKNAVVSANVTSLSDIDKHLDEQGEFIISGKNIDPAKAALTGQALGTAADTEDLIVIGHSSRENSAILSDSIKNGLLCTGVKVCDMGECTLPQLIFFLTKSKGKFLVYSDILSHSKITVLSSGGVTLDRKTELDFEKSLSRHSFRRVSGKSICQAAALDGHELFYTEHLNNILPEKFVNINAEIRTDSKIVAEIADKLFYPKNDIDGEKIIFHISSNGLKCTAYTDKTGTVSFERLACLAVDNAFEHGFTAAVPYTFTAAADYIAENRNGRLYRFYNSPFDNGDKSARTAAANVRNLFITDGLMLAVEICGIMSVKRKSLSELLENIPEIYTTERFVSTDVDEKTLEDAFNFNFSRPNEGIAINKRTSRTIIRPLKNGGGISIFAEATGWETASALCDDVIRKIKMLENGIEI